MPYFSDDIIEEVRSRNDIVDVIGQYVHLTKKGSTYFGLCPFHNEKTGSFSVSPNKQMYYCFGCGAGGNVFTFMMQYENFTFGEAMEALADRAGVALPKQEYSAAQKREADKKQRLLEINKEAARYFYTLLRNDRGKHALAYFQKRELSEETMKKVGISHQDSDAAGEECTRALTGDARSEQPFMHPVQELLSVPVTAKDMAIMLSSAIRMAE